MGTKNYLAAKLLYKTLTKQLKDETGQSHHGLVSSSPESWAMACHITFHSRTFNWGLKLGLPTFKARALFSLYYLACLPHQNSKWHTLNSHPRRSPFQALTSLASGTFEAIFKLRLCSLSLTSPGLRRRGKSFNNIYSTPWRDKGCNIRWPSQGKSGSYKRGGSYHVSYPKLFGGKAVYQSPILSSPSTL